MLELVNYVATTILLFIYCFAHRETLLEQEVMTDLRDRIVFFGPPHLII